MNAATAIARGAMLRGAHVTMNYGGRTLLGTVVEQRWLDVPDADVAGEYLRVRHFNGEAWPGSEFVAPCRVTLIPREV